MADVTKDWQLYLAGKNYNNRLVPNYYETVKANTEFFSGNQWLNAEIKSLPKPVFNILKRVITYQVASLCASKTTINIEPMAYMDDDAQFEMELNASDIANAEIKNLFEKFHMDNRKRDAMFDGAVMGDYCAHFYFDTEKQPYGGMFANIQGEICMELIDGNNVYFGNSNTKDTESQPYIILYGRDMVENLKAEAKRSKHGQEVEAITSDAYTNEQIGIGGQIEVDIEGDNTGKAGYIIVYRRDQKSKTIKVSKCVENAYIYKDIDTGLKHYPVAWGVWEKQKNQYHGRAVCTGLIPNQIFINRMFAMVMYHLMMSAFPKVVYDADKVNGWTNEIGAAIPLRNLSPGDSVGNLAQYVRPGEMSNQIIQCIELAMEYTKETLGISDAALGNIDPKNTSAIIAVQKSSVIPLDNPKANMHEWHEDIGKILIDMMGTYYGQRPIVIEREGQKVIEIFDFNMIKNLYLNVKVDAGDASYWSEIAAQQTLDNLLMNERIDFIDYLERIGDIIPKKQELINKLKEQAKVQQQNYEQMAQFMESLLPEVQAQLQAMPPEQMEIEIQRMMQGAPAAM